MASEQCDLGRNAVAVRATAFQQKICAFSSSLYTAIHTADVGHPLQGNYSSLTRRGAKDGLALHDTESRYAVFKHAAFQRI
jgi:hypothetical protein